VTHAEFEALVHRLEERARRAPRAYRLRVLALAALGYAYIGAVLLGLLGLLGGTVFLATYGRNLALLLKSGVGLAALAGMVGRSLWVRLEPPAGVPLTRDKAPALIDCVEELRRALRAPKVHRILVTYDFNAAMGQRPRLGVLGWQKNHLVLGLPFMLAASPEQFRAVVAHELGHLSGQHSRLNGWIYRLRSAWSRLDEQLEKEQHWGSFIFKPFFHWYAPFFNAWSFVLARSNEFEADRAAAGLTSPETTRDALVGFEVRARFLSERFWPAVHAGADDCPSPELNPFADMPKQFGTIAADDARAWVERALAEETTVFDTHPCLRERVEALGVEPRIPEADAETAAHAFLGRALPGLSARLAEKWCFDAALWWNERYEHVTAARKRLGELVSRAGAGLSPDESWELARLSEELEGADAALPLYRDMVEEDLEDARASFALGRLLLARGDETGLVYVDHAIELADDAILPGCELAYGFLIDRGREAEAELYRKKYLARSALVDRDREERNSLPFDASYVPHGLEPAALEDFRQRLARWPVKRAWLVRKQLEVFPERPLFVLGVERRVPWWRSGDDAKLRTALQDELARELDLPGEGFILVLNGRKRRYWNLFRPVAGAQILPA
jgi:Zn-dependent protease with chaperone function